MQIEGDVCDAQSEAVGLVGERDAVIGPGEDLTEQTKGGPVVVVHHFAAQAPAPGFLRGHHLLAEGDGERPDGLNGEAAREVILRICLVELLGERVRRRSLVHAHRLIEAAEDDVAGLGHQIAADGAAGIRETIFESGTCGVEQQARRLNRIAGDDDGFGALEMSDRRCRRNSGLR